MDVPLVPMLAEPVSDLRVKSAVSHLPAGTLKQISVDVLALALVFIAPVEKIVEGDLGMHTMILAGGISCGEPMLNLKFDAAGGLGFVENSFNRVQVVLRFYVDR